MSVNVSAPVGDIREGRRAAGISQQKLAALARCSVASVAMLERGYRPQRSQVLGRIIRVLDSLEKSESPGGTGLPQTTHEDGVRHDQE